jgi:hypothetical protein
MSSTSRTCCSVSFSARVSPSHLPVSRDDDRLTSTLAGLSDEVVRNIMQDNAAEFYRIDV